MKTTRFAICLFIIGFIFGCSGSSLGPNGGGQTTQKLKRVVLSNDQLISHAAGLPATSLPSDQSQPAVAYDTSFNTPNQGKYLTVWTDSQNVNANCGGVACGTDILGSICTGTGTGTGTTMTCGDSFVIANAAGNQSQPKAAFYKDTVTPANSKYLVVWTDSRNGYSQIYGQFVTNAGILSGGNFQISTHGANNQNQSDPDLIYNSVTNQFIVAWLDSSNLDASHTYTWNGSDCKNSATYSYVPLPFSDTNEVMAVTVSPAGALGAQEEISNIVFLSGFTPIGPSLTASWTVQMKESKPKISYSPMSGEKFVAWSGMNHTTTFSATYVADSNTCAIIPPATSCACGPSNPCVCAYSGATYTDTPNDTTPRIKLRKKAFNLVQDFTFGTIATSPALAIDPNTNRVLVAWEENSGGFDILGQLVDISSFVNYGNVINISNATGDQTSPVAAFDNVNQRYLVAWEDARNQSANISNMDIYGQFIDPQGNLSGGNSPVTTVSGNQIAPAIVFGDTNFTDFLVAWKDGRDPSNSDIYGQLLQYSTGPQLLITNSGGNPILNNAIDFGNVNVGQTSDIPIKICNNGNSQLTIQPLNGVQTPTIPDAPYSFTTPSPVTISPGTCYGMTVRFAPNAAGSYAGNPLNNFKTTINSDGGQVVLYFSGSGVGIQPLAVTTTSLPDASIGAPYSSTLTAFGGVFPFKWSISSGTLPNGLTLNPNTGVITGTPTTAGSFTFTVMVTDSNNPVNNTATRILTINVSLVTITKQGLKPWTQGIDYGLAPVETMTGFTSGGTPPYAWTVSSGSLPPGMSLNSTTGNFTGAPSLSGVFSFIVKATDAGGQIATKSFSITVNPTPAILTSSLPTGVVGASYSQLINMSGGTSPNTWSISSGSLAPGLSIDTGTGVISGTLSAAGTYTFTVKVTDAAGASASQSLTLQVNSLITINAINVPNAVVGATYSTTFTATGGTVPYLWSTGSGVPPAGLSLDSNTGVLSGTPTTAGTYQFTVKVTDQNSKSASQVYTITVAPGGTLTITTTGLKAWTVARGGYSDQLAAAGGNAPYTWSDGSSFGSLPPGLTLSSFGSISGTPTTAGSYSVFAKVTDSSGKSVTSNFAIVINPTLQISTATISSGTFGISYNQQIVLTGGTAPYTWEMTSGALPAGLSFDTTAGSISGIPSALGTSTFTIKVTDRTGAVATRNYTMSVVNAPVIVTSSLPDATASSPYSQTLIVSGGAAPNTWAVTGGTIPAGLSLNAATGSISGTPTAGGTYVFVVTVTDRDGRTATQTLSITISGSVSITTAGLKPWTVNRAYSDTLTAAGGKPPYQWSLSPWWTYNLPDGVSLDKNTGVISGQPSRAGIYLFYVNVTDANGATYEKDFTILINPALSVTTTTLQGGTKSVPYSQQVAITGGTSPYTWTIISGTLPSGLTLDTTTGIISGIALPNAALLSNFTVLVSDAAGASVTMNLSISIVDSMIITTPSLPNTFLTDNTYSETLTASGGRIPYTWSIIAGILPPGLSLNANTGIITGKATDIGTYSFVVQVTDTDKRTATKTFTISVATTTDMIVITRGAGTVPQDKIRFLNAGDLPALPLNYVMTKALQFEIDGVTPNGQVVVSVMYNSVGSNPVFYNFRNGFGLVQLSMCSSTGETDCIEAVDSTLKVVTLRILDNGRFDAIPAAGTILYNLITGYMSTSNNTISSSGGGGCSIGGRQNLPTSVADASLMLLPLAALAFIKGLRRRKK